MALVHIVYVPTADLRGPDEDRMDKLEDVPDDRARMMVDDGSGRWPTPEEIAAHLKQQAAGEPATAAEPATEPEPPTQAEAPEQAGTNDPEASPATVESAG